MHKRGDVQRLKGVLRLGALVFGVSAAVLIAVPGIFVDLLGSEASSSISWSLQLSGVTVLTLAGLMFVVAGSGTNKTVLWASRVMLVGAFSLGVVTLFIPTGVNLFVIFYALIGFAFAAAYGVFLTRKNSEESN